MSELTISAQSITDALKKNLADWSPETSEETVGYVTSIADGVAARETCLAAVDRIGRIGRVILAADEREYENRQQRQEPHARAHTRRAATSARQLRVRGRQSSGQRRRQISIFR